MFSVIATLCGFVGCSGDDRPPVGDLDPAGPGGTGSGGAGTGGGGAAGGSGGTSGAGDASGGAGATDATAPNCQNLVCSGPARCEVDNQGVARCVCDDGYVLDTDGTTCIVDKSCVRVRFLEGGCRTLLLGPPAVGLFFALDYCAGTAVLPGDLGSDPTSVFQVLEGGQPLSSESYAAIVERDVESFVTIAIDVSRSVTDPATGIFGPLLAEIRSFAAKLVAGPGEPPVTVAILVFGRFVELYLPPTQDLGRVDAALEEIQLDPTKAVDLVRDDGTALFLAVEKGINETQRMREFRSVVTDNGVLTTGTLVVVTDGKESTNAALNTSLVSSTQINLISIGVSSDIGAAELRDIGRDGAFLAPRPQDWTTSFDQIATRIDEYPDRAYLLGYCSSASTGTPEVTVTLSGFDEVTPATCKFNAEAFSHDPNDRCDADYLANACNGVECGSIFACGACPNDQCCSRTRCQAPGRNTACNGQDELCLPAQNGEVRCVKNETTMDPNDHTCVVPMSTGLDCSVTPCEAGVDYCDGMSKLCTPVTKGLGDPCGSPGPNAALCDTLACGRVNPNNPAEPLVCLPPARMYDACSGGNAQAVCELGTSCRSGICRVRGPSGLFTCSQPGDCASGYCDSTASKACRDQGTCHYSWTSKLDQ